MVFIKIFLLLFIFFSLLNLAVLDEVEPFHNVVSLLVPFDLESGNLIGRRLLLTLSLNFVLLKLIHKYIDEQFKLFNLILPRINVKKSFFQLIIYPLKKVGMILITKLLADLLFSQIIGLKNFDLFLLLTFSTFVTCLIWSEIFFLLNLYQFPSKIIYLTLVVLTMISNIFGSTTSSFTLFVPATMYLLKNPYNWLTAKLILLFVLFIVKDLRLRNFDYLGGSDHD